MAKEKINIGLDIGIASVGWSILDSNHKIIKHGVRLFPTVDDPKDSKLQNEKRREMRSFRRQIRRRQTRKRDFILFLLEKKFIKLDFKYDINKKSKRPIIKNEDIIQAFENKYKTIFAKFRIHQLREKGLKTNLKFEEQIFTLYWYLTRRGFSYQTSDDKKELEKIKKEWKTNIKDELPIHAEQVHFNKKGYINGEFRRLFNRKQWTNEITIFLKNQNLNQKIKNRFIELFNKQRSFEIGPGMVDDDTKTTIELYPTKWGRINPKNGQYFETMWENTVGKCSIFKNEYRAPKEALTSQIFNLLNDLNNIYTFSGKDKIKLDAKQKLEIIKLAFETKSFINKLEKWFINNNLPDINDWVGFNFDYKKTKKNKNKIPKKIINELSSVHEFNKQFNSLGIKFSFSDAFKSKKYLKNNIVDQYINICSKTKDPKKRKLKIISKIIKEKQNVQNFERFMNDIIHNAKGYSTNHRFSYKAMNKMIPILIEKNKNQEQIRHETNDLNQKIKSNIINNKYITKKWVNEEILSPTVKRSIIQTINVVNAIIKNYSQKYNIDNIVIEMARENNNKQAKDKIKNIQNIMQNRKEKVLGWIEELKKQNIDINKGNNLNKLLLFEEQKGIDVYTGKKIDFDKMVSQPNYCDVDHIIPYSISFDGSIRNKVLTLSSENAKKGKNTPFWYLGEEKFIKMKALWTSWYLNREESNFNKQYMKDKYLKLCDTNDYIKNPELAFGFIARNLVDTRYATRVILNKFTEFFNGSDTKIKVINGRFTSFIRKYIEKINPLLRPTINGVNLLSKENWNQKEYKKDRIWHGHHAEDATIVVVASLFNSRIRSMIEKKHSDPYSDKYNEKFSKHQKSEALLNTYSPKDSILLADLRKELNLKMNKMQFSYMIEKPKTTQLFNETLYGYVEYKEDDKIIYWKKSPIIIFDQTPKQLEKLFPKNINESNLLIANYRFRDEKLYYELRNIYLNYIDAKKPFKEVAKNNKYIDLGYQKIKKLYTLKAFTPKNSIFVNTNKIKSGFYESMEWVAIDIYENNKGKKVIIPVNAINHKFYNNGKNPTPIKEILDQQLLENNIKVKKSKLHRLYKGSTLKLESGDIVRVVGHSFKQGKLEIKYINAITNKCEKPKQWYASINTQLLNSKILHLDYLGNIQKILKF